MIFKVILTIILTVLEPFMEVVIPALPSRATTVLNTVFEYLDSAWGFVKVFLNTNLALNLFSWWISLAALFLTVELVIHIWRVVTGNSGGENPKNDGDTANNTN